MFPTFESLSKIVEVGVEIFEPILSNCSTAGLLENFKEKFAYIIKTKK